MHSLVNRISYLLFFPRTEKKVRSRSNTANGAVQTALWAAGSRTCGLVQTLWRRMRPPALSPSMSHLQPTAYLSSFAFDFTVEVRLAASLAPPRQTQQDSAASTSYDATLDHAPSSRPAVARLGAGAARERKEKKKGHDVAARRS